MGVLAEMWKDRQTHALPPAGRMWKEVQLDEFCDWLGIDEDEANALSVDWLLRLDILEFRITLVGARRCFVETEHERYEVAWEAREDMPTICLHKGERYSGRGPDFCSAGLSGLIVAYELGWLRKYQAEQGTEGS